MSSKLYFDIYLINKKLLFIKWIFKVRKYPLVISPLQ
jgi:hypothetical protein